MQETDPYTVRLPGGRTITRQIPRGASDAQIREAFRTPLARAGYDVSRSPILPGSQPARERAQPRPLARDPSNPTPNALAREYRPTWGQWLGDRVNALAEPLFGTTTANRMREEIGYVPFLGDAHIAGEGVSNIGAGNTFTGLGQVGLAAVGLIPGAGDVATAGIRGGARRAGGMFGGRGAGDLATPVASNTNRAFGIETPSWASPPNSSNYPDLRAYAWTVRERLTGQQAFDLTDDDIAYWTAIGRQRGGPLPDNANTPAPAPFRFGDDD